MAKKSEKPSKPKLEIVEVTEEAPKPRKSRAKKAPEPTEEPTVISEASEAKPKKAAAKPRKAKVKIKSESGEEIHIHVPVGAPFTHSGDDPVGDVSDGEGRFAAAVEDEPASEPRAEMAAHRADTTEAAIDGTLEHQPPQADAEDEKAEPAHEAARETEPAKLDRLQKILSQAGIASRRHAEELITEGRVQVNGQVVKQLGAKADAARDHIRVDGKLISGAERLRYYVLNKPKGYVTTVSDPEGRPTVMHFFEKMRERLYPVGRLDYQSEGLLLVTNDGELANQLTRAASGVEKTYLVKVAGEPTEEQIEQLRSGVAIDREGPGSGKVRTSPAEIRQVRRGDNPWFEVVLIEGRNRELRKMFSAIGHFVEKIRRVGYGPLVLDLEPGKFRELLPEELAALRLAAEGKWKPRRPKTTKMLPKDAGRAPEQRTFKSREAKPFREHTGRRENRDWKPREQRFGQRGTNPAFGNREDRPRGGKPALGERSAKPAFRERTGGAKPEYRERSGKPAFGTREDRPRGPRPAYGERGGKPAFGNREERPRGGKPGFGDRPRGPKPNFGRPQGDRPQGRPRFDREDSEFRPRQQTPGRNVSFRPQQRETEQGFDDRARRESSGGRGERPNFKSGGFDRSEAPQRRFDRPGGKGFNKPGTGGFKPRNEEFSDRSSGRQSNRFDRSGSSRSQGAARGWNQDREQDSAPFRGKPKPRFSSNDKPRTGRFKPSFGGKDKPSGNRSKPSFGSKPGSGPGFKSGIKRSGPPRPGGNRPGGRKRG